MYSKTYRQVPPRIWRFSLVAVVLLGCSRAPDEVALDVSSDQVQSSIASDARHAAVDEVKVADASDSEATPVAGEPSGETREAAIAAAGQLASQGDLAGASRSLQQWLLIDPADVEVLFRLASIRAADGNLDQAVELLDEIPREHPEAGLPALGQSADWCFQLQRFGEAESRYRKVIARAPAAIPPRRQLAYLLNRQGRRHEAAEQLYELCRHGDVHQDELHALVILTDAMYDDPSQPEKLQAGTLPYWPIGKSGKARQLFALQQYDQVLVELRELVESGDAPPAVSALYGRAAAEAQDDEQFLWWLAQVTPQVARFADYWAAIGAYESRNRRFPEAVRALAEALLRDPSDFHSMSRIRQPLIALGQDDLADRWNSRWAATRDVVKFNNKIAESTKLDLDSIAELSVRLLQLGRRLEAVLWKTVESGHRGVNAAEINRLNAERRQVIAMGKDIPSHAERLCGMNLDQYPLPKFDSLLAEPSEFRLASDGQPEPVRASFPNVASSVGLNHSYQVSSQTVSQQFSIHQTLGGGVAVIDFDLDGCVDLYFAQGGSDPPASQSELSNQLYRCLEQEVGNEIQSGFVDVTEASGTRETQYGLGVTSGDWNQDGFPDLVVSNIGIDTLFVNNGDGTFARRGLSLSTNPDRVPSSVAIADLNGDHLPDIFQCVYVDDARINRKPAINEDGRVLKAVSPGDYKVGADTLIVNDGKGGAFEDRGLRATSFRSETRDHSYGLGVIVTDLDGRPGNEVFVGNDLLPNQLWTRDPIKQRWDDVASLKGCAYDGGGVATGSMGIAVGDFDDSGTIDIHISNYEYQNSSLFLSDGEAFQDRTVQFGLAEPTRKMVGFGSQSIDITNDGTLDLIVTNGHLDDTVENRSEFRQPPQLFSNSGSRFVPVQLDDSSDYWSSLFLGRGLARLDFNRDGKSDIVVTHIGQPSALLVNQTTSENHWLQVQLVGTDSERDAIGAEVHVRWNDRESVDWVAAGDGYLSCNESAICFGLGAALVPVEVEVRWPSGKRQVHRDIQSDQRILIVENQPECTQLF
ncbi:FG-GAP-like repeat-containing protein [Neorhodopirellula lusitana]|uniref:FG-GAP-like repeat-containing protein n=1 Tax=Neorhodopirellula lusitana TaxID=445327 RepID=UPI00384A6B16